MHPRVLSERVQGTLVSTTLLALLIHLALEVVVHVLA